jgi:hypothetical protein
MPEPSETLRAAAARLRDRSYYAETGEPDTSLQLDTALATWLDATATEMDAAAGTEYEAHPDGSDFDSWNAALAVARVILGEV